MAKLVQVKILDGTESDMVAVKRYLDGFGMLTFDENAYVFLITSDRYDLATLSKAELDALKDRVDAAITEYNKT